MQKRSECWSWDGPGAVGALKTLEDSCRLPLKLCLACCLRSLSCIHPEIGLTGIVRAVLDLYYGAVESQVRWIVGVAFYPRFPALTTVVNPTLLWP
jgi:hypothetical protein